MTAPSSCVEMDVREVPSPCPPAGREASVSPPGPVRRHSFINLDDAVSISTGVLGVHRDESLPTEKQGPSPPPVDEDTLPYAPGLDLELGRDELL